MQSYNKIRLNGRVFTPDNIESFEQGEEWQKQIVDFLKKWFDNEEYISVNTSGSTGTPKIIDLKKQSMVNSAKATIDFFGLNAQTDALLCLPASHIAGRMMLVRAMVGEFNLVCTAPGRRPFENTTEPFSFVAVTPYQLSYSLNDIYDKKPEKVIVGGAGIPSEIIDAVQKLQSNIFETYGMTETCSHIAIRAVNGAGKSANFHTLKNIRIRKNNDNCLCINAPHLHNTEIITNDIVVLNDENTFQIIGRLDNVINTGGIKVQPEQLEKKLEKLINKPFYISSLPDKNLGNKVILVIEGHPEDKENENKLMSQISEILTRYEKPREILYIPAFIYTSNNKLLKSETLKAALIHNNKD